MVILKPNLEEKNLRNMIFDTMEKAKGSLALIFYFVLLWNVMETDSQCDIFVLIFDACSIKLLLRKSGKGSPIWKTMRLIT